LVTQDEQVGRFAKGKRLPHQTASAHIERACQACLTGSIFEYAPRLIRPQLKPSPNSGGVERPRVGRRVSALHDERQARHVQQIRILNE
jgi:hypothetical protein